MHKIVDGKKLAHFIYFIDPDIVEKLEALEREKMLEAGGFYDSEDMEEDEDERARIDLSHKMTSQRLKKCKRGSQMITQRTKAGLGPSRIGPRRRPLGGAPPTIEPFSVVGPSTLVTSTGDIYNPSSRDASPTPTPPAAAQTPPPHSPADTTMSDNVDMSGAQGPAPPPYGAGVAPPPVQPPPAPAPAPAPQGGQPAPAPAPAPALAPGVEQLTQPAQPFVHVDANRSTREWTIGHYNTAVARGDPAEIERYAHAARIRTIMGNPDIVRIVDQLTQARGGDRLHRVFAAVNTIHAELI
ncbi:hypothetical protein DFH09DRAFT_1102814 [Mycena vulgaris]|nr:hypothetical protein DFH09DRAFT_1102814 [Mycena vulgaris]